MSADTIIPLALLGVVALVMIGLWRRGVGT